MLAPDADIEAHIADGCPACSWRQYRGNSWRRDRLGARLWCHNEKRSIGWARRTFSSRVDQQATALALVQTGRLDRDTEVNLYLKSWKVPANLSGGETKVTLRVLLNHSAGATVHGFDGDLSTSRFGCHCFCKVTLTDCPAGTVTSVST